MTTTELPNEAELWAAFIRGTYRAEFCFIGELRRGQEYHLQHDINIQQDRWDCHLHATAIVVIRLIQKHHEFRLGIRLAPSTTVA